MKLSRNGASGQRADERSAEPRPSMRRVLAEMRPYRRTAVKGILATAAQTGFASIAPLIVALAVDRGIVKRDMRVVVIAAGLYALIAVGQTISMWAQARLMGVLSQDYQRDLRSRLLSHMFRLDVDFFTHERSGRLVARLTSDVENLAQFLGGGLGILVEAVLVIVLTVTLMAVLSIPLTLASIAVVPVLAITLMLFQRRAFVAQLQVRESVASMLTRLNEALAGIRVVHAYGLEDFQRRAFQEVNRDALDAKLSVARVGARFYPVIEFLHPVALAVVIGVGAWLTSREVVAVGTVVAFTLYVGRLFQPLQQFMELAQLMQAASASFSRVFAFLDERPGVSDAPDAEAFSPGPGDVHLEEVSFRYGPDAPEVLRGISLRLHAGERIALVGASGAGKSTLAKLIARFHDPSDGRVLVDGQDLRRVRRDSLGRHVALVAQEGFLFDGSIADNIGAAARDGRESVDEAWRELELERALDLPDGLETDVIGRGRSLSAGQQQLVALARAFVAEPRVLILDEATSNLDPATEISVERASRRLLEGRTAIVIAHRVATALRCDRVIVLEGGRVAEDGPPAELASRDGAFARWLRAGGETA